MQTIAIAQTIDFKTVRIFQIDAFADAPFTGNPAAVCLLGDREPDERWMQNVAAEMNLSETAFLRKTGNDWALRWFTPAIEVALCGHATLASAHALREEGLLSSDGTARFHTKSGVLTATQCGELIEMDFPAKHAEPAAPAEGLIEALGVHPVRVSRNEFDYLLEMANEEDVRTMQPDHAVLRRVPVRGVIVTSRASTPGFDFISRFFAPGSGIDEDPVTGSAHCALGPYWAPRLGKNAFVAYQASRRGGVIRVTVNGGRVGLSGRAVTVFRGDLRF
jgi:PhzF family phenazine biosynthesis protein